MLALPSITNFFNDISDNESILTESNQQEIVLSQPIGLQDPTLSRLLTTNITSILKPTNCLSIQIKFTGFYMTKVLVINCYDTLFKKTLLIPFLVNVPIL